MPLGRPRISPGDSPSWQICPVDEITSEGAAGGSGPGHRGPGTALRPPSAGPAVQQLLGLTADLWTSPNIQPHPAYDAIKALSRFGQNLPADAVDPVLELLDRASRPGAR